MIPLICGISRNKTSKSTNIKQEQTCKPCSQGASVGGEYKLPVPRREGSRQHGWRAWGEAVFQSDGSCTCGELGTCSNLSHHHTVHLKLTPYYVSTVLKRIKEKNLSTEPPTNGMCNKCQLVLLSDEKKNISTTHIP